MVFGPLLMQYGGGSGTDVYDPKARKSGTGGATGLL